MIVALIVAYAAPNRAIGVDGALPWHLPRDLVRFRKLTMGHTLLMGRRTLESLQGRRLAGRRIILLSRSIKHAPANADALAASLDDGLQRARDEFHESQLFLAGGESIYREALARDLVDRMYLTIVQADVAGDAFFPEFEPDRWRLVDQDQQPADERHAYPFQFKALERAEGRSSTG